MTTDYLIVRHLSGQPEYWGPDGWHADRSLATVYPTVDAADRQMRAFLRETHGRMAYAAVCRVLEDGELKPL